MLNPGAQASSPAIVACMFERCASSDDWAPFRLMNLLPSQWHEKHPRASSLQESPVVSVARVDDPKPEIAKFLVQTYEPVALAVAREAPESQLVAREPRRQRCEGVQPQAGDCKVPGSTILHRYRDKSRGQFMPLNKVLKRLGIGSSECFARAVLLTPEPFDVRTRECAMAFGYVLVADREMPEELELRG